MVRFKAVRSHKPGGMNVDHRSTKVHMWIRVDNLPLEPEEKRKIRQKLAHHINHEDELWVECEETRSQDTNRELALEHLNKLVESTLREDPIRIPNEPPFGVEEKRIQDKKIVSRKKAERREGHIPHGNP